MQDVISLLGLWFFVGVKFLIGPVSVLAYGLSRWETVLFVSCAGTFWSGVFYYAGAGMQLWYRKKFPPKKKKRLFTKSNRRLVRIKNKFGVWGLALLIPIISVPISALLASKYFKHERYVWLRYLVSCTFWATVLTFFSDHILLALKALLV